MISIRARQEGRMAIVDDPGRHSWTDVRAPSKDELALLESSYGIKQEHIQDILDIDEQSRFEKEDEYSLVIVRLPVYDPELEVPYFTIPCGIVLFADRVVTLCMRDNDVLAELANGKQKEVAPQNKSAFVLQLLGRAAIVFLRYLKDLNRRTAAIERELQRSIENGELIQLLALEKSLVFFTTSLKSNEILLEKLTNSRLMRFKEDEEDLLEDVVTDNRQAIEMSAIYSDILSGMMDAFASVISNNLNLVMRRLTTISVILMMSTLVVSAFSMNVDSPLTGVANAFWIILGISGGSSLIGAVLLKDRKSKRRKKIAVQAVGMVAAPARKLSS